MNISVLDSYLKHVQQLSCRLDHEPSALQELLHSIEISKDALGQGSTLEEFFKGEYAFYSSNYERALKHYLEAKNVEKFEFFCFRASAFVFKGQGHLDKAVSFAKKALEIKPDYPTLRLLGELLTSLGRHHEAQEAISQARVLNDQFSFSHQNHPTAKENTHHSKMTIGEKEREELAGIFLPAQSSDELFAADSLVTTAATGHTRKGNVYDFVAETASSSILRESVSNDISLNSLRSTLAKKYQARLKHRQNSSDDCLIILQGWDDHLRTVFANQPNEEHYDLPTLFTEEIFKSTDGIFLRWKSKGVAINPGRNFLKNLHRAGLHIGDINIVICTKEDPHSYEDIRKLHEIIYQLNHATGEHHVIHYYLHQKAFHALSGTLKPRFKQERNTVHCLDLIVDHHEIEKVDLSPDIKLYYAYNIETTSHHHIHSKERTNMEPLSLSIKLELLHGEHSVRERPLSIGCLAEHCSAHVCNNIRQCDVLLLSAADVHSENLCCGRQDDSEIKLHSLIMTLDPKFILCTDFEGSNGDNRLEIVRKLRNELRMSSPELTILPADNGLFLDLKTLAVKGTFTNSLLDPTIVKVTTSSGPFSPLVYHSESCVL